MKTPFATTLCDRVRRFIEKEALLETAGELCAGFSGGADSTALLLILRRLGVELTAVHLHHGLRGCEADRDARWCETFCRDHGIRFEMHRLDVAGTRGPAEGVEAAARRCRLEFWRERLGSGAGTLALGHHADDAVETLLMRLVRGSNCSGLVGLRPAAQVCGVRIVRPLLELRRSEIERFLCEVGVTSWCEDGTNADTRSLRNAVRHVWLPAMRRTLPGADAGLRRSLEALRCDADFLDRVATDCAADLRTRQQLREMHPAERGRVLRLWLRSRTGRDIPLSRAVIQKLNAVLAAPCAGPRQVPVDRDVVLIIEHDRLRLRGPHRRVAERRWAWRSRPELELEEIGAKLVAERTTAAAADAAGTGTGAIELFVEAGLPDVLTVRARRAGDRLVPFGRKRPKKLQDLFVNARVPRELRDGVPLVVAGERIIWAAGVCRAEFGRVPSVERAVPVVRFYFQGPQAERLRTGSAGG